MSYEKRTTKHRCPCGKGEYEVAHQENNWGQRDECHKMLCIECNQLYKYVHGGEWYKGIEGDRGWILKSVIEDEKKKKQEDFNHRTEVGKILNEFYFEVWESKFEKCKNKKQVWEILTLNGKYSPSLSSFYSMFKGLQTEVCINSLYKYFNYDNILRVLEICEGNNPNWELLGLNGYEVKAFETQWNLLKGE